MQEAAVSDPESCNSVESRVQAMVLRQQDVVRGLSLPIQVPRVDKHQPIKSSRSSQAWKKPPRPPSSKKQQPIDRDFASKLLVLEAIKANETTRTQRRLERICKKNKSISPPPPPSSSFQYATVASLVFTFVVAALLLFQGVASMYSSRSTTEVQDDDINKVTNWTPLVPTSQQHDELYQHLKPPEDSSASIRNIRSRRLLRQTSSRRP